MKLNRILFLALTFIYLSANAESYVYITDQVDIPLRSEDTIQSNPSNILRMLPSGTRLEILATQEGWTKVKFEDTVGWMTSRYLVPAIPAQIRLKQLTQTYNTNKLLLAKQQKTNQKLEKMQKKLKQDNATLLIEASKNKSEKQHIKQVYQDALKLEHQNQKLTTQISRLKSEIRLLQNNQTSDQETSARNWFIAGALVLLLGLFIGFVFSKRNHQNQRRF